MTGTVRLEQKLGLAVGEVPSEFSVKDGKWECLPRWAAKPQVFPGCRWVCTGPEMKGKAWG